MESQNSALHCVRPAAENHRPSGSLLRRLLLASGVPTPVSACVAAPAATSSAPAAIGFPALRPLITQVRFFPGLLIVK